MNGFNLSEWALRHASLVWFFMVIALVAGTMSFFNLGREEDPTFAIKTMLVQANWPGATLDETMNQITERIESELKQIDELDYTKSYTTPGQTTIFVNLTDSTKGEDVSDAFTEVRRRISDIWGQLPQGAQGPFFNDQFGDVYGNIYAFTADGITFRQLRDYVEQSKKQVSDVPNVGSIQIVGAQDEAIYLNFSIRQMASLGIDMQSVFTSLQNQNAVSPSGVIQAGAERISIRTEGAFTSEESLKTINLRVNNRFFKLSDIATINRGYVDPPSIMFRYNGQPAIGLAVAMRPKANLLAFGKALDQRMEEIESDLPLGVGFHLVSDQPEIVKEAIGGFTKALLEAVVIVIIVSLVALGIRAGLIVALAVPLTLAIVFVVMEYLGISLQRISLGALIISLGLLVDDAMITVEMMVKRLELGDNLQKAAVHAYTSTAFPMLTGTLVTVAGFMPIALNSSQAGEYTISMFIVIAVALLVSWMVAVLFAPLLGVKLLRQKIGHKHGKKSKFAIAFNFSLSKAMRYRWITLGSTIMIFILSIYGASQLQFEFFPASDRSELLVDITLPQNSTITETRSQMDRFEKYLDGDSDIEHWSSYVGQGALRFYLPLDQQLPNPFFGQIVIVAKDIDARERLNKRLKILAHEEFVGTDILVHPLALGLPIGRPILYRVSGPDIQKVRELALDLGGRLDANPDVTNITYNWNEPARTLKIQINQDRARQLGISSADVSTMFNAAVNGLTITQVRDSIYLIDVIARASYEDRNSLELLESLQIPIKTGQVVPLLSFATIGYELEQPIVWRWNGRPTLSVQGFAVGSKQPLLVSLDISPTIDEFQKSLPAGYTVETGGLIEGTGDAALPLLPVLPMMMLVMAVFLMIQLQDISKLFIVVSVAPLGFIGVVAVLLLFEKPLGFIAILGVLALIGIIIRNSVILVDQITTNEKQGMHRWHAVQQATEHRMRPILLTAAAASLGMIPIASEVFWGPMAFAMIGGIVAATFLTLFFLPALYVAWYRVEEPEQLSDEGQATGAE